MRTEDRVLCLCTRQQFEDKHLRSLADLCSDSQVDWHYVLETAREQGVLPLVGLNLSRASVGSLYLPDGIRQAFRQALVENMLRKRAMLPVLEQVLSLFARERIDVMLVKGAALSLSVYDHAWYTRNADVDLVIRSRREELSPEQARQILGTLDRFNQSPGVKEHIEYDFFAHHDITMNDVLPIDFQRIWAEARRTDFHGHQVLIMSPEDTLIAAAINACRKRFFRLKSLLDMAEIVQRMPIDWSALAVRAREYRCGSILYTALILTDITLGCPIPEGFIDCLPVSLPRAALIRWLISLLCRRATFGALSHRYRLSLLNRQPSLSLILTYATYPFPAVLRKFAEIWRAERIETEDPRHP